MGRATTAATATTFRWPTSPASFLALVMPVEAGLRCHSAHHEESTLLLNQGGPILP